jgi:hypothetical protein
MIPKSTMSDNDTVQRVLTDWEAGVQSGQDASFAGWTFFDTNCLSDLAKLTDKGEVERLHNYVRGHHIAITSTNLQELRHVPPIAQRIPEAFQTATLYLIPHPTKFWDCDVWNFINTQGVRRNVMEAYPLPTGFFEALNSSPDLIASFQRAESRAENEFFAQIERDRNERVHDRKLLAMIWGKASDLARDRYGFELPVADCRPENFPSIFTYYYTYYFRYIVQAHVKPNKNDFNDLAHTCAAPYCRLFCAERKLAQLLRNQVKDRVSPTPYQTAKRMFAEGLVDDEVHERARRSDDMRRPVTPLLSHTTILTQSELMDTVRAT